MSHYWMEWEDGVMCSEGQQSVSTRDKLLSIVVGNEQLLFYGLITFTQCTYLVIYK